MPVGAILNLKSYFDDKIKGMFILFLKSKASIIRNIRTNQSAQGWIGLTHVYLQFGKGRAILLAVRLNKAQFEYDIHSIIKAFYPAETVKVFEEGTKDF